MQSNYDVRLVYANAQLKRVTAQCDALLAACEAMLEAINDQGLDWFNTPILAEIEQMQAAIAVGRLVDIPA